MKCLQRPHDQKVTHKDTLLSQLKSANEKDMIKLDLGVIWPMLNSPALLGVRPYPGYLSNKIESVQKRATTVIYQSLAY